MVVLIGKQFFPYHDQGTFQALLFPLVSHVVQFENQDNRTAKMLSISLLYLLFFRDFLPLPGEGM